MDAYEEIRRRVEDVLTDDKAEGDRAHVERVARAEVDKWQQAARSGLAGSGRVLSNPESALNRLVRSFCDYGPWTPYLSGDIDFTELQCQGNVLTHLDQDGVLHASGEPTTVEELRYCMERFLIANGAHVDETHPFTEFQTIDGSLRVTVMVSPIAKSGLDVDIRRYVMRRGNLARLIETDMISRPAANLVFAAISTQPSGVVVSGPRGAGKTTLMNGLLGQIPPHLGMFVIEDSPELYTDHLNVFRTLTRAASASGEGAITMADLVKLSLRFFVGLLVLGEIRDDAAYSIMKAGNAGSGLLATTHGNSPDMALEGLVASAVLAQPNISERHVRANLGRIINLVVHVEAEPTAFLGANTRSLRRQVMKIVAVPPQLDGTHFGTTTLFKRERIGDPLLYTGDDLPPELEERLDRALEPIGVSARKLLEGQESLF